MAERTSIKLRNRTHVTPMSAEECAQRAADLFAKAERVPHGKGRSAILKEACDFRMLAEMKRIMAAAKRV